MSKSKQEAAWTDQTLANPHALPDKAERVKQMFAAIAPSYDRNNRLHSLGRDRKWREAAVEMSEVQSSDVVLDVATGTGDLALAYTQAEPKRVIGVDFTHEMVQIADAKRPRRSSTRLTYQVADATRLPLADRSVDVVSIAFGIRNVGDVGAAMREFYRVLRGGGRLIVLEFSTPGNPILRGSYQLYFRHIMPRTASLLAWDRSGAYRYLPQSVNTFLDREGIVAAMEEAGFASVRQKPLTFGIAVCYRGYRM